MATNKRKRPNSGRLSEKEARFVQLVGEGKHALGWCLRMAGYSRSTAETQGARIRRRPRVQRAIIAERVKRGLFCTEAELALVGKKS